MNQILTTPEFDTWLENLRDCTAQATITKRLVMVTHGHFGDHASVGDGVSELRIHYGPGYRLYFTRRKGVVVILLLGGDKSSQSRDIARAKAIVKAME